MNWVIANLYWIVPSALSIIGFIAGYAIKGLKEAKANRKKEIEMLKADIDRLKTELKEYKSLEKFQQSLQYVDTGFYFRASNDGSTNEYYCARCLDNNGKKIRIIIQEDGDYTCPVCKNTGLFNEKMRHVFYERHHKKMSSDYDWQAQNFLTYNVK